MANTELLKQLAEAGKRERTSGPTPEKILRIQRVDVGSLQNLKNEITEKVMDVVDLEFEKAKGKIDGRVQDFADSISALNLRIRESVTATTATYSASNSTTRRTIDADDTTLNELADLVCTLISDLQNSRIIK